MENKIWLTSDWHFCHNKEFLYKPRGFETIDEMNEAILQRHNEVVSPNDTVYVLGDLVLNDLDKGIEYIKQLNGKINVILGNHDGDSRIEMYKSCPNIVNISRAELLKYKKYQFYLSHFPMYMGNYDAQMSRAWCIHGHTHSKNDFDDNMPKNYNVNMDAHNCYPIEINKVLENIRNKWNEIYQQQVYTFDK